VKANQNQFRNSWNRDFFIVRYCIYRRRGEWSNNSEKNSVLYISFVHAYQQYF